MCDVKNTIIFMMNSKTKAGRYVTVGNGSRNDEEKQFLKCLETICFRKNKIR